MQAAAGTDCTPNNTEQYKSESGGPSISSPLNNHYITGHSHTRPSIQHTHIKMMISRSWPRYSANLWQGIGSLVTHTPVHSFQHTHLKMMISRSWPKYSGSTRRQKPSSSTAPMAASSVLSSFGLACNRVSGLGKCRIDMLYGRLRKTFFSADYVFGQSHVNIKRFKGVSKYVMCTL
jgi:hypothetical protein